MNSKSFLSRSIVFSALFVSVFSAAGRAQTINAEKSGWVASYVVNSEVNSGLIRKRFAISPGIDIVNSAIPTAAQLLLFEKEAFALINQKRAEMGLEPLLWSADVAKVARLHSENMAKYNFFGHQGIDRKMVNDRADALGITKWTAMGENIAFNRGYQKPIKCAVEKWLESTGHRENLLNGRWKESAIGIAVRGDGTFYFTQVFLVRK